MNIVERVAYLRGLSEGLNLNSEKPETKMFNAIMDVLDDLAESTTDLEDTIGVMTEQLDAVDEDLGSLEEIFYDDDFDDDFSCSGDDEEDDDADEEEYYEVECPSCHEVINVDEGILEEGGIECPNCGEKLEFEIEFDEDAPAATEE